MQSGASLPLLPVFRRGFTDIKNPRYMFVGVQEMVILLSTITWLLSLGWSHDSREVLYTWPALMRATAETQAVFVRASNN